jgi:c(7)-type cytochrome triheme protein
VKKLFLVVFLLLCTTYIFARVGGGDIVFKVGFGNVTFSHDGHVGMGLLCKSCHPEPFLTKDKHKKVTMAEMNKGKSCGKCHNGKDAFTTKGNCKTCHVKK